MDRLPGGKKAYEIMEDGHRSDYTGKKRAELGIEKTALAYPLSRPESHWKCCAMLKERTIRWFRKRRPCRQAEVVKVAQEEWGGSLGSAYIL